MLCCAVGLSTRSLCSAWQLRRFACLRRRTRPQKNSESSLKSRLRKSRQAEKEATKLASKVLGPLEQLHDEALASSGGVTRRAGAISGGSQPHTDALGQAQVCVRLEV